MFLVNNIVIIKERNYISDNKSKTNNLKTSYFCARNAVLKKIVTEFSKRRIFIKSKRPQIFSFLNSANKGLQFDV
jgi:hypothetical protein